MEYLPSIWTRAGETLSHKNACKEFGLTEAEVFDAIRAGRLQYRQNYAHGNPYFKLIRGEVENLARDLRGSDWLKQQEINFRLKKIGSEINSLKRKLIALEKERAQLLQQQETS